MQIANEKKNAYAGSEKLNTAWSVSEKKNGYANCKKFNAVQSAREKNDYDNNKKLSSA